MDKESKPDGLSQARVRLAVLRADGTLKTSPRQDPITKSAGDPKSLRKAINAKCWECAGGGQDGEAFTRETIRTCTVACPLKVLRPYQEVGTVLAPKLGKE